MNSPSEGRRELDSVVINVELTLASIIQGVALFFLTDNARALMSMRHWGAFLYVVAVHTLTLIRWPLEFGHNFFYIACALGEAILFTRLDDPLAWFQLSAAYSGIVWLLFMYDMRLIHARIVESHDDSEHALYARARSDQLLNIRLLVPLLVVLNVVSTLAIWGWPDLFVARAGHIWLISAQLLSFIGYLFYTSRYFTAIAPLLLRSRRTN